MRGKLVPLTVLTLLLTGGATANAAPFGRYIGYGGPVTSLGCTSMTIGGAANTVLGDIDTAAYEGCSFSFGFNLDVVPRLPWQLSPTTLTTYDVDDIEADISGPFCEASVYGSASVSYDSVTGVLTVDSQSMTVTDVDPANDCLGLITQGEHIQVLPDSYDVVVAV